MKIHSNFVILYLIFYLFVYIFEVPINEHILYMKIVCIILVTTWWRQIYSE